MSTIERAAALSRVRTALAIAEKEEGMSGYKLELERQLFHNYDLWNGMSIKVIKEELGTGVTPPVDIGLCLRLGKMNAKYRDELAVTVSDLRERNKQLNVSLTRTGALLDSAKERIYRLEYMTRNQQGQNLAIALCGLGLILITTIMATS